jgi:hypothetical protein
MTRLSVLWNLCNPGCSRCCCHTYTLYFSAPYTPEFTILWDLFGCCKGTMRFLLKQHTHLHTSVLQHSPSKLCQLKIMPHLWRMQIGMHLFVSLVGSCACCDVLCVYANRAPVHHSNLSRPVPHQGWQKQTLQAIFGQSKLNIVQAGQLLQPINPHLVYSRGTLTSNTSFLS